MNNQTAQSILKSWPEDSREAAQLVIDKYGEPDEVTETMLIWHNNAPWVKTIATRKAHEHLFPVPHIDAVEQYIRSVSYTHLDVYKRQVPHACGHGQDAAAVAGGARFEV